MNVASVYVEAAFTLAVTGAAMVYPPLALLVGALFLVVLAIVTDKRTPPAGGTEANQ